MTVRRRHATDWIERIETKSGQIRYKANRRWPDGRKESKRFGLRRDAQTWIDERRKDDRPASGASQMTVSEAWTKRMTAASHLGRTTRPEYERTFDRWIRPYIGDALIRDVTPEDVEDWIARMTRDGASDATAAKCLRYVRPLFRRAHLRGHIRVQPTATVGAQVRHQAAIQPSLTIDELDQLIAGVRERYRALVVVLGYVGMRPGEAVALLVGDFDPKAGTIHVSRHATSDGGRAIQIEPATKGGTNRIVPLEPDVVDELVAHLERSYGPGWRFQRSALLFPNRPGAVRSQTPISVANLLRRELRPVADRLGLYADDVEDGKMIRRPFTTYWLRHTAARHAIAAGFDPVIVCRMLGHAQPSITLNRYASWFNLAAARRDLARLSQYRDAERAAAREDAADR